MRVSFTLPLSIRAIAPSLSKVYGCEIVAPTITVDGKARPVVDGTASLRLTVTQTAILRSKGASLLTAKSIDLPVAKRGRKAKPSMTFSSWLTAGKAPAKSAPTGKRTTRPAKSAPAASVDPSVS